LNADEKLQRLKATRKTANENIKFRRSLAGKLVTVGVDDWRRTA